MARDPTTFIALPRFILPPAHFTFGTGAGLVRSWLAGLIPSGLDVRIWQIVPDGSYFAARRCGDPLPTGALLGMAACWVPFAASIPRLALGRRSEGLN